MVRHIHDAGYNVVMYDHRGQGESGGGLAANHAVSRLPWARA